MEIVVYSQYYRSRTPDRQLEIDECLRRNLNHPGISRMVLFCERDAPPVPEGTVPVEVVSGDERLTYAEWFRRVKHQGSGIGLLLNADIFLDEGLEHLAASFGTPEAFLALTRYNPGHAGFHLNDYPHWTQDVWGVRTDTEIALTTGLTCEESFASSASTSISEITTIGTRKPEGWSTCSPHLRGVLKPC